MSEQPKISGELEAIRRNLPSKPYPAPRGSVIYHGTPEYEASLRERAPQFAVNEAARVVRAAEVAANNERRAEIRAELDRIEAELDAWKTEHEPHYQTMEAARLTQLRKNAAFEKAYKSYQAEKLSHPALVRSAIAAQAATDAHNALIPAYNARIEHHDKLWRQRLDKEKLLYSIKP